MADNPHANEGAAPAPRGGFCILHDPETLPYELCLAEYPSQLLEWAVDILNDADAEQESDVAELLPLLGVLLRPGNVILLLITRDPARMVEWATRFVTETEDDRARAAQQVNADIQERVISDDAATLIGSDSEEDGEEENIDDQSYDSENDDVDDHSSHGNHPPEPNGRNTPPRSRRNIATLPLRRQHDDRSRSPRLRNYNDRSRSPLRPDYECYSVPRT